MRRIIHTIKLHFAILILAGIILPGGTALAEKNDHKPITQELKQLVKKNPEIESMLKKSIAGAKRINPDPKTNPVRSLNDYYDYIDTASELIPQAVLDNPKNLIQDEILQSICYFYFLVDQPLDELKNKGLFKNTIQYYKPFSAWLLKFANAWGAYLNTDKSWNEKVYQEFLNNPIYNLKKGWYESPAKWKTFNQFFARFLKSPAARPIASPDDAGVVTSPADSVPQGTWAIDGDSKIKVENGIKIKLATFYSIEDLLGAKSKYKDAFANGVLTHTFLNVNDYHRFHFAVGGIIKETNIISQNVALEVAWNPKEGKYDPIDSTGWQFSQTRGYVVLDTKKYGLVALIPMGMAQVSSVNFEGNVKVGKTRKKGDMLGNFLFGGSDFVMLFEKEAGFEITAPIEKKGSGGKATTYKHLLMGEKYGVMKGNGK